MSAGTFGWGAAFPRVWGGGPRRIEYIYAALNAGRGNAYDTQNWASPVLIENRTLASEIDAMWAGYEHAANQFDPTRTTDMLPRWERIHGIFPYPGDNDSQRRLRLTFYWSAPLKDPHYQQVVDDLTTLMGPVFVGLVHTSSAQSRTIYPGGPNTNPYEIHGTTELGVSSVDWASGIAYVAVQIQWPAGMSATAYQRALDEGLRYLDDALPAWNQLGVFSVVGFTLDSANFGVACLDS